MDCFRFETGTTTERQNWSRRRKTDMTKELKKNVERNHRIVAFQQGIVKEMAKNNNYYYAITVVAGEASVDDVNRITWVLPTLVRSVELNDAGKELPLTSCMHSSDSGEPASRCLSSAVNWRAG